jgi:protein-L-isoaspartate(D-aspartate) O-methyltransferase
MAYLARRSADNFEARLTFGVQFIPFSGARDPQASIQLAEALNRDSGVPVKSLRCDPHVKNDTCWLHGEAWCFSKNEPVVLD